MTVISSDTVTVRNYPRDDASPMAAGMISRIMPIRGSGHSRRRPSAVGPKITQAESLYFTRKTWKREMSSTGEGYQCGASVPQLSTVSIELRGRGGVGVALLIAKHDGAKAMLRLSPFAGEDESRGFAGTPSIRGARYKSSSTSLYHRR